MLSNVKSKGKWIYKKKYPAKKYIIEEYERIISILEKRANLPDNFLVDKDVEKLLGKTDSVQNFTRITILRYFYSGEEYGQMTYVYFENEESCYCNAQFSEENQYFLPCSSQSISALLSYLREKNSRSPKRKYLKELVPQDRFEIYVFSTESVYANTFFYTYEYSELFDSLKEGWFD
jgi:hypothetical protein